MKEHPHSAIRTPNSAFSHALFWFTAANALLAFLNGCAYLSIEGIRPGSAGWGFALFALWGQVASVCLILGLLFAALGATGPGAALSRWLAPPVFALVQVLIQIDKVIF